MCTAITYKTKGFYFGRNLDYEVSYNENIVTMPRNYCLEYKYVDNVDSHYAMLGIASVIDNRPLYYDAFNEKGLCMAGLNFVGNAYYNGEVIDNKDNIATFEFIPWILGTCASVAEARVLLDKINLTDDRFREDLPVAQLHWIIADKDECIVVESMREGLFVYDNPVGVLTNNPSFKQQMFNLNNYMHLSNGSPKNNFAKGVEFDEYSRGMGAIGLPGDVSSQSRFVRAAFNKLNSLSNETEESSVAQFFHVLGSVEQIRGCTKVGEDAYEITIYTSCCSVDKGTYYYKTYDSLEVKSVDMYTSDLEGKDIEIKGLE